MKKSELLNSDLSYEISKMGHTQTILIGDCGLPIPNGVKRIDLAVKRGVPSFADVLETVLSELCVEKYIVAEELHTENVNMDHYIKRTMGLVPSEVVSHEELKKMSEHVVCIVRTGEASPYANIILQSGVRF